MSLLDRAGQAAVVFDIPTPLLRIDVQAQGLIHDTFVVTAGSSRHEEQFILQRINQQVFADPTSLMENVECVLAHLAAKSIQARNDDGASSDNMTLIRTKRGTLWHRDEDEAWRVFRFVDGAVSINRGPSATEAFQIGRTFGRFLDDMADFRTECLHTVLPGYRDTQGYLDAFSHAVEQDVLNRAADVHEEIRWIESSERDMLRLQRLQLSGQISIRAIHGDAKLSNVLLDTNTGIGICAIDLDTVMPGLLLHDLCDCVREALSVGLQGEHLAIELDEQMVSAIVSGFLSSLTESPSALEIDSIVPGIRSIALELGMRFLADFVSGDRYFQTTFPAENLHRARQQIGLAQMISAKEAMLRYAVKQCVISLRTGNCRDH